jgi:hypothetical protein
VKGFDFLHKELTQLFMSYHKVPLKSELLQGIPYFVPQWLGGLGLNPGPEPKNYITENHRKCASIIYRSLATKRPRPIHDAKACLLHNFVQRSYDDFFTLKKGNNTVTSGMLARINENIIVKPLNPKYTKALFHDESEIDLERATQECYSRFIESTWRNTNLADFFLNTSDKSFARASEKAQKRAISYNSSLWRQAFNRIQKGGTYEPLPWYRLWHQKQFSLMPFVLKDWSRTNSDFISAVQTEHFEEADVLMSRLTR